MNIANYTKSSNAAFVQLCDNHKISNLGFRIALIRDYIPDLVPNKDLCDKMLAGAFSEMELYKAFDTFFNLAGGDNRCFRDSVVMYVLENLELSNDTFLNDLLCAGVKISAEKLLSLKTLFNKALLTRDDYTNYIKDVCARSSVDSLREAYKKIYKPMKITQYEKDELDTYLIRRFRTYDNVYTREITRKWFIAMVMRNMGKIIDFHNILILTGAQGCGKSSLFKDLASAISPEMAMHLFCQGSEWTYKDEKLNRIYLKAAFIIFDDISKSNSRDTLEQIKEFSQTLALVFRKLYSDIVTEIPLRHVIGITTNRDDIVQSDSEYQRRFWILPCFKSERGINYRRYSDLRYIRRILNIAVNIAKDMTDDEIHDLNTLSIEAIEYMKSEQDRNSINNKNVTFDWILDQIFNTACYSRDSFLRNDSECISEIKSNIYNCSNVQTKYNTKITKINAKLVISVARDLIKDTKLSQNKLTSFLRMKGIEVVKSNGNYYYVDNRTEYDSNNYDKLFTENSKYSDIEDTYYNNWKNSLETPPTKPTEPTKPTTPTKPSQDVIEPVNAANSNFFNDGSEAAKKRAALNAKIQKEKLEKKVQKVFDKCNIEVSEYVEEAKETNRDSDNMITEDLVPGRVDNEGTLHLQYKGKNYEAAKAKEGDIVDSRYNWEDDIPF